MDELIIVLFQNVYHWTKRKYKFYLYNYRGKKNSSFVDYGIALCHENEYEARYTRDSNGRGEVIIEVSSLYRVFSNLKGTYSIELLDALCIEPQWIDFAKTKSMEDKDGFSFNARYDDNGNIQLDICCEIEADPKEKDARLYINGYMQNGLEERRLQLIKELNEYRKNNPQPKIKYNI